LGDLRIEGVRLLGEVEDVRPALARAGALLVPLLVGGGTRLKLLEAAAYGVPIVATRVAAEGLALHDGTHLRLVERIEHLADAALEVLDQRASARERCEAARAVVLEHYAWQVAASAVLDVWRRAAAHTVA
jgi:glycosyltransferase involved in cell wall biosynthesis